VAECLNRWLADSTNEPHLLNETFWDASDVQPSIVPRNVFYCPLISWKPSYGGHRLPRTGPLESPRRVVTFLRARRGCKRRLGTAVTVFAFLAVYAHCALTYAQTLHSAPAVYRTAVSVSALSQEQASKAESDGLRGVVKRCTARGLALQNRTGGTWINWNHTAEPVRAGDEIEVKGVVDPGRFTAVVKATSVRKVGDSALPKPANAVRHHVNTIMEKLQAADR